MFYFSIEDVFEQDDETSMQVFEIDEYPNDYTFLDFIINVTELPYYKLMFNNKVLDIYDKLTDYNTSPENPLVFCKTQTKNLMFTVKNNTGSHKLIKLELPVDTTFELPLKMLMNSKYIDNNISDYYVRYLGTNYNFSDKIPDNENTTVLSLSVFNKEE